MPFIGLEKRPTYRALLQSVPEKPFSLPYDLRTEMKWVDFANPMNPLGTPKALVQAMHSALVEGELSYVPDRDGHAFRNEVARYHNLKSNCILAGSSTLSLITAAAQAYAPCTVGVAAPCPIEYLTVIGNAGHDYVQLVNSNPSALSCGDAYTMHETYGRFEGALLGNPSYPASRLLPMKTLVHYLETCSWVIVDETFVELSFGAASAVQLTQQYPNLMVVRSVSTMFGMPGVPISYLVAHPDTIAAIEQFHDGCDISMFAEVLAKPFLQQADFIEQTHDYLDTEIPWMQCQLSLLPGIRIHPAEGNYVLCKFDASDELRLGVTCAEELIVRLQLAGYMLHHLRDVIGLADDNYFVVSIRSREDNQALLDAIRKALCG